MPSLSTTPSGAATLQGHGLVVADGALGRAMARLLLEQVPALTLTLTGRTLDPRPDTRQLLQQALDRLAYGALDLCRMSNWQISGPTWIGWMAPCDWCSMPVAGSMASPPSDP